MQPRAFAVELRAGQERLAALAAQLEGAAPQGGGRVPLADVVAGLHEVRALHGLCLQFVQLPLAHIHLHSTVGVAWQLARLLREFLRLVSNLTWQLQAQHHCNSLSSCARCRRGWGA